MTDWLDPQWKDPCFNPLLAGIRHADALNTVSPGYADEILLRSDHANGFFGGEGLERELIERKKEGALSGILNGCEYPSAPRVPRLSTDELLANVQEELVRSSGLLKGAGAVQLEALRRFKPEFILTGVTRIVEQKVKLFLENGPGGKSALQRLLGLLGERNGACVLIGSGIPEYEEQFISLSEKNRRFIFIRGYSEKISEALYASGDLFLMPSSFEPCGISQMIAMREGQPCVVHAVGGLRDTVTDGVNGFTFDGKGLHGQVDSFVGAVTRGVRMLLEDNTRWEAVRNAARNARFTWEASARQYLRLMDLA
jgi:starch synthase